MISKDKEYTTRSGLEHRIYAYDGAKDYPIHGAIKIDGEWVFRIWDKNGHCYYGNQHDLIEKPKTIKVVRHVYYGKHIGENYVFREMLAKEKYNEYTYLGTIEKEFELPTDND